VTSCSISHDRNILPRFIQTWLVVDGIWTTLLQDNLLTWDFWKEVGVFLKTRCSELCKLLHPWRCISKLGVEPSTISTAVIWEFSNWQHITPLSQSNTPPVVAQWTHSRWWFLQRRFSRDIHARPAMTVTTANLHECAFSMASTSVSPVYQLIVIVVIVEKVGCILWLFIAKKSIKKCKSSLRTSKPEIHSSAWKLQCYSKGAESGD